MKCIPETKARYTRYKFCIQVSIQENLDQENLNSSLCIHDARNVDEYTQVLAGDTTNKMSFLGGEEAGWWFSSGTAVSSTNKFDPHDITEILLKMALNTITLITTE